MFRPWYLLLGPCYTHRPDSRPKPGRGAAQESTVKSGVPAPPSVSTAGLTPAHLSWVPWVALSSGGQVEPLCHVAKGSSSENIWLNRNLLKLDQTKGGDL